MANIGDKIRIIYLQGELSDRYSGREGIVESIDTHGKLHGTWGRLSLIPDLDKFEIIEHGKTE